MQLISFEIVSFVIHLKHDTSLSKILLESDNAGNNIDPARMEKIWHRLEFRE